eukprot:514243-Amphidinium_carterae.3
MDWLSSYNSNVANQRQINSSIDCFHISSFEIAPAMTQASSLQRFAKPGVLLPCADGQRFTTRLFV